MATNSQNGVNPWEVGLKHVAKGAVALAIPVALAFAVIPAGAALLTSAFSWGAAATVAKVGIGTAVAWGGGLGAAFGAIKSLTTVDDAIKIAEQDKIFIDQQRLTFAQKQQLMAQQASLGAGMAAGAGQMLTPNVGYAQQQGQGGYRNI